MHYYYICTIIKLYLKVGTYYDGGVCDSIFKWKTKPYERKNAVNFLWVLLQCMGHEALSADAYGRQRTLEYIDSIWWCGKDHAAWLQKNKRIREEVVDSMGGKVLDHEAKDILRQGYKNGYDEGMKTVIEIFQSVKDGIVGLSDGAERLGMKEEELAQYM